MRESWKPIPSHPELEASTFGRIRSIRRQVRFVDVLGREQWRWKPERILSSRPQNSGYEFVHFKINNELFGRTVHRLVAETFLGKCPRNLQTCHRDGNRKNNRPTNLRYDTGANNCQDAKAHGTYYKRITSAKLNPLSVKQIRKLKGKLSSAVIGRKFGVGSSTVRRIWNRKLWSHV